MLRQVGGKSENRIDEVCMADASYPVPFKSGLEFNAPVHGTWNIVHIGMQLPEAIQIYVCAQNCMRGVVLTAAEMNAADRFSFVILSEKDMVSGDVEEATIRGVIDVIEKRKDMPKAVLLFTVCAHHFLGCDYNRIYRELEAHFPEIVFHRCYMDPIMQKKGLTPDQKLRRAILEKLPQREAKENVVSLLGSDFLLDEECELVSLLQDNDMNLRQLKTCRTYDEFKNLSEGSAFVCIYPPAKVGAELVAKRLERPFYYLPANFSYELIETQMNQLADGLHLPEQDYSVQRHACDVVLEKAKEVIGDTSIAIDYTVHPRTLGLAKLLIMHGFCVERIYIDGINREEEAEFHWLKEHAPDLILSATIHVNKRVCARGCGEKVLAIGQKAAWFEDTPWFVNMVSGAGLYGYSGIQRMAELMVEAYRTPKDTKDIAPRKGWGCESCL